MHVYILEGKDRIKIGYSDCPQNRLTGIQVHTTDDLKLAYTSKPLDKFKLVERIAHKLLSTHKTKGEWFRVSTEEGIEAVEKAIQIVETGQEDWYLIPKKYKYKRVNVTLLGQVSQDLEKVRLLMEKDSGERLSLAEVVNRLVNKALAKELELSNSIEQSKL